MTRRRRLGLLVVLAVIGTCVACSRNDANRSSGREAAVLPSATSSASSTPGPNAPSSAPAVSHGEDLDPQEFGRSFTLPTVAFEEPLIQGDLSVSDAGRVIRQRSGALNLCYWQLLERALANKQAVEPCSLLETAFLVNADGSVGTVSVATEDRALEQCVAEAMRRLVFSRPSNGSARVKQMLHLVKPRRVEASQP